MRLRTLLLSTFVAILVLIASAGSAVAQTQVADFTDLTGHWAAPFVRTLLFAGVIEPEDSRFRPDDPVNRLDFTTWVAAALELPAEDVPTEAPFRDWEAIPEDQRGKVLAAVKAGLINGYPDQTFKPDGLITRAELAVIFGRALKAMGVTPEERFLSLFADADQLPAWAGDALAAVRAQIIIGLPRNGGMYFAPMEHTTRGQAATMIVRFIEKRVEILGIERPQPVYDLKPAGPVQVAYYMIDAYEDLLKYGHRLDWIFYVSYNLVDSDGNIQGHDGPSTFRWAAGSGKPLVAVIAAHDRSINDAFLRNTGARARFTAAVKDLVRRGYSGVHLDFEYVPAVHRETFTQFVQTLAAELRSEGLHVSIALPAKTSDDPSNDWSGAFDYEALGKAVDYVMIMTYDQHWRGGEPGPVGSIAWMRSVLKYATSLIPPNKVLVGIPAYGYDWPVAGGVGRSIKSRDAVKLAADHGIAWEYDPATAEASFTYVDADGQRRVVYFTPPEGIAAKTGLVAEFGLGGFAMWRLGQEMDDYWRVFK